MNYLVNLLVGEAETAVKGLTLGNHNCVIARYLLSYYATFKLKKLESLFYKINTCLQKTITCIGLQGEQIFPVNI